MLLLFRSSASGVRRSELRALGAAALAFAFGLSPADASAITGVCPDGSVFVVRRSADVPCREAKRVDPSEVPPLRPENLPRAYLWDVHRQKIDQNNPYNLVERAARVRGSGAPEGTAEEGTEGAPEATLPQVASAPPVAAPISAPPSLGLTDGELRDLFYLVELSQQRTPVTFLRDSKGGGEALRVSLAHSQAFEARLRGGSTAAGPVLLFSVQPKANEHFLPNFTFVQQHLTFTPRRDDPTQLGLLSGRIGELGPDELVLGYVVLPATLDLRRPLDVYWDDRQLGATFQP